ncbi:MAG: DUF2752 domain-containing protein [Lentisphaerae bacterium]|nr:DUF2752 domain-containing protein [Lentisphaerota bacterium]
MASFFFYVAWNLHWLGQGRLPPSLLRGLVGLPSPTTGMTRSCLALRQGDLVQSLGWHPLTLPLLALYLGSIFFVLWRLLRRRPYALPPWVARTWLVLLALSWAIKLLQGPAWW